jgi:hypothetical protein
MQNTMGLDGVTPWGRRAFEYMKFFGLGEHHASHKLLDCGGGPSSFAAEQTSRGWDVTAIDPMYAWDETAIRAAVEDAARRIGGNLVSQSHRFCWDFYGDLDRLLTLRQEALDLFLSDYAEGQRCGRYQCGELPVLGFASKTFDLALCSHLLFLYSGDLDLNFHVAALAELSRVAKEVRVFPLMNLDGLPSPHVPAVLDRLGATGLDVFLEPVDFEFQRGATSMLVIRGHGSP